MLALILALLIAIISLIVSVLNPMIVHLNYLVGEVDIYLPFLIILLLSAGMLLGFLLSLRLSQVRKKT